MEWLCVRFPPQLQGYTRGPQNKKRKVNESKRHYKKNRECAKGLTITHKWQQIFFCPILLNIWENVLYNCIHIFYFNFYWALLTIFRFLALSMLAKLFSSIFVLKSITFYCLIYILSTGKNFLKEYTHRRNYKIRFFRQLIFQNICINLIYLKHLWKFQKDWTS